MPPILATLMILTENNIMYNDYRRKDFANPGSALRVAKKGNPRNLPCPTCKEPNRLTPADVRRGYQCDDCANREEGCF